jgi:hypothetical protein
LDWTVILIKESVCFNESENNGNGFATESVTTDFKSFNVDVIALGDLQINDNIGFI